MSNGFSDEGIAFYGSGRGVSVYEFREPATGRAFYTVSKIEGTGDGMTFCGIAFRIPPTGTRGAVPVARYRNKDTGVYLYTAGHESPFIVGAYYFGSFSNEAKNIIDGTERVYNRKNDWWGGVEDFYGSQVGIPVDHRGWLGQWDELKPAIGYYDQSDVRTLEQHITQAADAGLSFFNFYWYWSNTALKEKLGAALRSFEKARNRDRLKFSITVFAHPWDDDMAIGPKTEELVVNRLVDLLGDTQYLRLPSGRPLIAVGDSRNIWSNGGQKCADKACNISALSRFIEHLRRNTMRRLGVNPFIEIDVGVPDWDRTQLADGITCLVPPIAIAGGTPYPELKGDDYSAQQRTEKPFSPCAMENFDERPRQDILISNRSDVRYFEGRSDEKFRHNLEVVKGIAEAGFSVTHNAASRVINLYAWNEWHEGGILEPNVASGAETLNSVTDVFQLSRSPSDCLERNKCSIQ